MAVVDDRDKTHPQDHILDTSIPMNNDYTRDLINKVMAAEAVEAENQRRHRFHVPLLTPAPAVRHVDQQQQRFDAEKIDAGEEDHELSLELSLGLSSNGRFGFDPNAKKIKRTASISELSMMIPVSAAGSGSGGGNLIRTCSLPVESREEWLRRKQEWLRRKELQSQRRMEARRRKNEKRRQSRTSRERNSSRERGAGTEDGGENSNDNNLVEQQRANADGGLIRTTSLVRRVGGIVLNNGKEIDQVVPFSLSPSGGSIGGSGSSSGTAETDVQKHGQGTTPMETENSNPGNTIEPQNKTKVVNFLEGSSSSKIAEPQNKKVYDFLEGSSSNKIAGPQNKIMTVNWLGAQNRTTTGRNRFDDMPSVTTKGIGPHGRRIAGFLYKYGRGKEVRIVCVCHGSFLTPAEFVKHAGGGDVPNPLQQIVVTSSLS